MIPKENFDRYSIKSCNFWHLHFPNVGPNHYVKSGIPPQHYLYAIVASGVAIAETFGLPTPSTTANPDAKIFDRIVYSLIT